MRRFRVLIADIDPAIRRLINANLETSVFQTFIAMDSTEALNILRKESLDLIVLDSMLYPRNGLEILHLVRDRSRTPVIMLCVQDNDPGKIRYLTSGADDCLSKPFRIEELKARILNILHRMESFSLPLKYPTFSCGELQIQFEERRVTVSDREIKLTPTEYNLLQELALNAEKVLTHTILLNKIWGPEYAQEREYLRVFVQRLRKKLEPDPHKPNYIVTVPWVGYKLNLTPPGDSDKPGMKTRFYT